MNGQKAKKMRQNHNNEIQAQIIITLDKNNQIYVEGNKGNPYVAIKILSEAIKAITNHTEQQFIRMVKEHESSIRLPDMADVLAANKQGVFQN